MSAISLLNATTIRGIIILFSYFICLINLSKINKSKFKRFYLIIYILIKVYLKIELN